MSCAELNDGRGGKAPLETSSAPPAQSKVAQGRLCRAVSLWVAPRMETPKGQLLPVLATLTVKPIFFKNFFFMLKWNFLCSNVCPLHLVMSLGATENSLALSSLLTPSGVYAHWEDRGHSWFPSINWLLRVCGCFALLVLFHLELWGISVLPGPAAVLGFLCVLFAFRGKSSADAHVH